MRRSVPLRRTEFRVRPRGVGGSLRSQRRIQPVSEKRRGQLVQRATLLLGLKSEVGFLCEFCRSPRCEPLDGHETRKPRARYWLAPDYVVILGRPCHERCEASYKQGRLEIPGTRSTGWGFQIVYAANKWEARA